MNVINLTLKVYFRHLGGFPLGMLLKASKGKVKITKTENYHPSELSFMLKMNLKSVKKNTRKLYRS